MLTVACYLWSGPAAYGPADVARLKDMVGRHLSIPHEFVCITDDASRLSGSNIRSVPLLTVPDPGRMFAHQKLMTFHPEAGDLLGERILAIDLDTVIVGNLDAIAGRPEPLVLWRNPSRRPGTPCRRALYNSSLVLLTAGAHPEIWEMACAGESRRFPGDQDWISAVIGPDAPYWDGVRDGVYRLGRADTPGSGVGATLPDNARVVFFPGDNGKPWLPEIRAACPWLEAHWPA